MRENWKPGLFTSFQRSGEEREEERDRPLEEEREEEVERDDEEEGEDGEKRDLINGSM